jgi:hypothetical protein
MMKAYHRVEWSYLEANMLKIGIHHTFVASIMRIVTSVSFFAMFNGERARVFKPTRGIHRGDLILPYLFLLATEGMSCLLRSRGTKIYQASLWRP